jgi:hypothetical protein
MNTIQQVSGIIQDVGGPGSPILASIGPFHHDGCEESAPYFGIIKRPSRTCVASQFHEGTFCFLAYPSCLGVVDPSFRTIDLICDRVRAAGDRAAIIDLDSVARRAKTTID